MNKERIIIFFKKVKRPLNMEKAWTIIDKLFAQIVRRSTVCFFSGWRVLPNVENATSPYFKRRV